VETVPLAAVPPLLLSTDQTTPEFEGSLNTVAVSCTVCDADIVTAARLGLTETLRPPAMMVIVAEAVFVLSLTEVAVKVTVAGLGALGGAL
jgi:hypothetical protein